jgi:RNA 2',3'-cyclic 3'-phosphodiesterase
VRAFIATKVAPTPRLRTLLQELSESGADIKTVEEENLHITYKFLGDVEPGQVATILAVLKEAALPPAFETEIRGAGAFPDWKKLSVLWAGVEDGQGLLNQIATAIDEAAAQHGWPREERAFRSHITLARRRSARDMAAARRILEAARDQPLGGLRVDHVDLIESRLTPEGAKYTTLGSRRL